MFGGALTRGLHRRPNHRPGRQCGVRETAYRPPVSVATRMALILVRPNNIAGELPAVQAEPAEPAEVSITAACSDRRVSLSFAGTGTNEVPVLVSEHSAEVALTAVL